MRTLVSLFTGAGGLDYGFEVADFETRAAIEVDPDCCATLRENRKWPVLEGYIDDFPSEQILVKSRLKPGDVDVVLGGPPCQPFSKAGYWASGDAKRLSDPRAATLDAFMRVVEDLQPKVFLLENVAGIRYSGKEEGFRLLEELTDRINRRKGTRYKLSWDVLNAAWYGVPQLRQRFFLVGHREGWKFKFPYATHGDGTRMPDGEGAAQMTLPSPPSEKQLLPYVAVWHSIGQLPGPRPDEDLRIGGKWAELLPSIPEGENYLYHTPRGGGRPLFGWRTRYWSFLLKLAKRLPSWTIQAQPGPAIGPFHWENRMLSVREMAAIQTFPGQIRFVGNRRSIQRQIGNAVPSLLAEVLARAIGEQFFQQKPVEQLTLAVKIGGEIPPPEPLKAVPEKYWSLEGDHPEHPGTGKGPAATAEYLSRRVGG